LGVVAPGGVELVEPIWSCPSSLLSLVALWGVSSDDEGIEASSRRAKQQKDGKNQQEDGKSQ
jgi:hypothetical protein